MERRWPINPSVGWRLGELIVTLWYVRNWTFHIFILVDPANEILVSDETQTMTGYRIKEEKSDRETIKLIKIWSTRRVTFTQFHTETTTKKNEESFNEVLCEQQTKFRQVCCSLKICDGVMVFYELSWELLNDFKKKIEKKCSTFNQLFDFHPLLFTNRHWRHHQHVIWSHENLKIHERRILTSRLSPTRLSISIYYSQDEISRGNSISFFTQNCHQINIFVFFPHTGRTLNIAVLYSILNWNTG